ncbi:MAG TPA: lipopolysaccharide biosynthesis protein RfbH [Bryobacteraceae bacterium]|nr:lipopolysaccharide biosynthesis protein RfbH [Bryobacteraceae bacterium]
MSPINLEQQAEKKSALKQQILSLVREYYEVAHTPAAFEPGRSRVPYAGRVYDHQEMTLLADSALDFWLTAGPYAERFERRMRQYFECRDFLLVNSGSSANLLMVSTLCSPELARTLRPGTLGPLESGDEVITPAVTFPTTVAPLVQNRLVPVFVDCEVGTYNINPALIEDAIGSRTRAILVPHTLGNPCDMEIITEVSRRHGLWLLEDTCDALGSTFNGQLVGTFGEMASLSFFPAHHITMGEGGGVAINAFGLQKVVRSIRDWGRDCWCDPGQSNTCGTRFCWQSGQLPFGYDHKYTYSNIGYNLKATDLQAAVGLAQTEKLPAFTDARRRNFQRLYEGLREWEDYLILPRTDPRANPSPFGFAITVRPGVDRAGLVRYLEDARIETRLVFGGNIVRQPGFLHIQKRIAGDLTESDRVMRDTFFIGVYPGLTAEMIDYVLDTFRTFFRSAGQRPSLLVTVAAAAGQ